MILLLIVMSGLLNDFLRGESDRIQVEDYSASDTYSETYAGDALPQVVIAGRVEDIMAQ